MRNHSEAFKVKVAMAAITGDEIMPLVAQLIGVHGNQIKQFKTDLVERDDMLFDSDS